MSYKAKTGHDQALVDLVDLTPQPASDGLEYTRETDSASESIYAEAPFIWLKWSALTISDYTTLLGQFGLTVSNRTQAVTVYIPNEIYTEARYNGTAVLPRKGSEVQRREYFLRDVRILVRDLELSA